MKHEFQSFWYGSSLSPYENLCIKSFIDHGHSFRLYTYDDLTVPHGVELCDAAGILPREEVFLYPSGPEAGGVSAFANLFRYALLSKMGGWWTDMDIICLSGSVPEVEMFFALEAPGLVNNALLHFPSNHVAMQRCYDESKSLGRNIKFIATGPTLLTAVLTDLNMVELAQPAQTCYPIPWNDFLLFFDPKSRTSLELRTQSSFAMHLWNELIRRTTLDKRKSPPKNSYLDSLFREYGIEQSAERYSFPEIYCLQKINYFKGRLKGILRDRLHIELRQSP